MSPDLVPLDGIQQALDDLKASLAAEYARSLGISLGAGLDVLATQERLGYTPQFDTASIADDAYDAMSHHEIYAKAQTLNPEGITGISGNWRNLGYAAADDTATFAEQIGTIVGTLWQGPAAEAAGHGVVRYANAALELAVASNAFADKVGQSHDGVSSTKVTIPPPDSDSFVNSAVDVLSTVTFGAIKSREYEREEAEERARTVMKTVYAPAIRQAAEQIPVLPRALNPLNGSDGVTSPSGFGVPGPHGAPMAAEPFRAPGGGSPSDPTAEPRTSPPSPTTNDGAAGSPPPASPEDTATRSAGWTPSESASPSTSAAGAGNPSTAGGTSAANSGAGSMLGAAPSRNSSGGTGAGSGSGFGGTGSGRLGGSGGGGAFGSGFPAGGGSPGGGAFGSPVGAGASGIGAGSGGAPAGRPGSPGMGGMGMAPAAGRGGPGGDDDVHATPGYLIDAVNGDELIGTLPLVAPPVLGA